MYIRKQMVEDFSEIVTNIKQSIAFVSVMQGGSFKAQGSGFVFSKSGILVTCNHVVLDPFDKIFIFFPDMKAGNYIEAKVVTRDIKHDIAILEFNDSDNRKPLALYPKDASEGMPVYFLGYPLGLRSLTTHQGILSSITIDATGIKTFLIDGTVNQGNSGCPLLTSDGFVIGVVTATQREDKDLLESVASIKSGAISLHGVDLIEIYQALIKNLQLGIGYAVPCAYIPKQ